MMTSIRDHFERALALHYSEEAQGGFREFLDECCTPPRRGRFIGWVYEGQSFLTRRGAFRAFREDMLEAYEEITGTTPGVPFMRALRAVEREA